MRNSWTPNIFILSFVLIALIKQHEYLHLTPFYKSQRTIKLKNFAEARLKAPKPEQVNLALWESMITGRANGIPVSLKKKYQELGLSHIFTPSGFHLSSVIGPVMLLFKSKKARGSFLILISSLMMLLPGLSALKRMSLIKLAQQYFGQKSGFVVAIFLDAILGTFNDSPLSFSFSLLFLGIVYSGKDKFKLIFLFFTAQCLIVFFSTQSISLLNIVSNPILNLIFASCLPLLFALAIPLWDWQLSIGLTILSILNKLVEFTSFINQHLPFLEVNIFTLLIFGFCYLKDRKIIVIGLMIFSQSLNFDGEKNPGPPRYLFKPSGEVMKSFTYVNYDLIYFRDGKCKRRLVNGVWWESCSPRRGSSYKKY